MDRIPTSAPTAYSTGDVTDARQMSNTQTHWNQTYEAKGDQVSWFQLGPGRSFAMIGRAALRKTAAIIDVGAGASRLADALLADGFKDITLLDISDVALARTRARLGAAAHSLSFIVADVTQWRPERTFDLWHDRAVFHFLTTTAAQNAYIAALKEGTRPGSLILLATFALTGPETCSGLPVQRYSPDTLAQRLGRDFALEAASQETHQTPFGTSQDFTYAQFRRCAAS